MSKVKIITKNVMARKFFLTALVVLALVVIAVCAMRFFSGEDDWICSAGQWVKHGRPSAAMPTNGCGTVTSTVKSTGQAALKTYMNADFGFSFSYPAEWGNVEESTFSGTFPFPSKEARAYLKGEQYYIKFSNLDKDGGMGSVYIMWQTNDFGYPTEIISVPDVTDVGLPALEYSSHNNGVDIFVGKPILSNETMGLSPFGGIQENAFYYSGTMKNVKGIGLYFSWSLSEKEIGDLIKISTPVENESKYYPYGPQDVQTHFVVDENKLSDDKIKKALDGYDSFVSSFKLQSN